MKTKFLITVFMGIFFLILLPNSNLKAQNCDTVAVTEDRTEIPRDPDVVLVYADWLARRTICVVNADLAEAGYYKIFMETKNDPAPQINESYFLTIKYPDGTFAPICDPNLDQWKVVPDTVGVNPSGLRYAGSFFFEAGVNQIILNHYAEIAPDFPDFWIGASDSASIVNGPTNSVHCIRLTLEKSTDRYDLALTYTAQTDTSLEINGNLEQVVSIGETYNYTLSVVNQGSNSANDVTLWMVPPDSVQLSNFNIPNDYIAGDTLFWIFNEIVPAQKIDIIYQAKVAPLIPNTPFQLYSEGMVQAGCDTDQTNNFDDVTVYAIDPFDYFGADLVLTQTANTDTILEINGNPEQVVPIGDIYSYELNVTNQGPNPAQNAVLWIIPPDSVTLLNFNVPPSNTSGDTIFWIFPNLAPTQQIDITFQADVADTIPTTPFELELISEVEYRYETDPVNNSAQNSVYAIDPFNFFGADITLDVAAQTDTSLLINGNLEQVVPIGEIYSYNLTVVNQGPNAADDVVLWIFPPDSVDLINFNIQPTNTSDDTIFWTFPNLTPAQQIDITFQADVADILPATPFELELTSQVDYLYDTNATNNTAQNFVYAIDPFDFFGADIGLDIIAQTDTTLLINGNMEQAVPIGEIYSYTINVSNQGPNSAQNVELWIVPPDSVDLINFNVQPTQTSGDTLFWTFPNMAPMQQEDITFQADVADVLPGTPYELPLNGNVAYQYDPNPANNSAQVSVYAFDPLNVFGADIVLNAAAQTDTSLLINGNLEQVVFIGDLYSYKLNVSNQGPNTATNVILWIIEPDSVGLFNFSVLPTRTSGDSIFWTFPNMPPTQQIDITFQADVADVIPATPFKLKLNGNVDYFYDTNPTNNSAQNSVYAINPFNFFGADIKLGLSAKTDTSLLINGNLEQAVPIGQIYSYDLDITNQGPNSAQNVTLWIVPPDSVNLINFNIPPNFTSGDTLFWRFPELTPAQQFQITCQADVADNIPTTPFELELNSNIHYEFDPNPANNSVQNSVYAFDPFNIFGADITLVQTAQTDTNLIINGNLEQATMVGDTYSYRIKIRNEGPNIARDFVLWMIPPDSVQLGNFNIQPNFSSGDTLFWNLNELTVGQQKDLTFQATVVDVLPELPYELILISNLDFVYDINPANNSVQNSVFAVDPSTIYGADISLVQTAKTDTSVIINGNLEQAVPVGDNYSYKLSITNLGPNTAKDVVLWIIPPDSVNLINFNVQPKAISGDTIFWEFNQINQNQPIDITFQANVADSIPILPFELLLESNVDYPFDSNPANNAAESSVYAIDPFDIFGTDLIFSQSAQTDTTIIIGGNLEQVEPVGDAYIYELIIGNNGPNPAQDVILWAIPPDSVQLSNFNFPPDSSSGDTLFWIFNEIPINQQVEIIFRADVAESLPTVPFELIIESNVIYPFDTDTTNNKAENTVFAIDPIPYFGADIQLNYVAQTDTSIEINGNMEQAVVTGGTYSYELTVVNDGPVDVANVNLWITKPDSTTLYNFNIQPTSMVDDTIFWKYLQMTNGQQINITFSALVNQLLPIKPFQLFSESKVNYKYDTSPTNNAANVTVYATDAYKPAVCDTVLVTQDVTEIPRDPNTLVVIADVIPRRSMCAVHAEVTEPGYYQIFVETLYDNDQKNESYFMSVQYPDGSFAPLCDPNLGPWKVVADTLTSNAVEQRNAGSFYFDAGVNKIILNHYAKIAADYPDFWVGTSDSLSLLTAPESVHTVKIVMVKVNDGFDVALSYTAQTDTSIMLGNQLEQVVNLGGSYTCELNLTNQGNQTASDLVLWITEPESVEFLNFSIHPTSASSDTLFWLFDTLAPTQQINMTFDASVAQSYPVTPFRLLSESAVNVRCDANLTNNSADVTVFAVDPCDYFVPESPQIEVTTPLVEVGDSVTVRVWLPKGVVSWDMIVRYVDGATDQTYADDFISSTALVENQWMEIDPLFTNTRLVTAAEHEDIIFEIQTTDVCGNVGSAQVSITVRSSDDCLLDRNVFTPAGTSPLGIKFKLSTNRNAKVDLYDITGYHITKITEGPYNAGWNTYPWDGRTEEGQPVGSGVYIITIRSGKLDCVLKVIIAR